MAKERRFQKQTPLLLVCAVKKSTNDGYVRRYIDQISGIRFGTLDIPAYFNSKVVYIVNHIYEIMTTSERYTLTQLCEIERTQILTISSSAQTNPLMAGYLLTGNRSNFIHIEGASLWLYECQYYFLPLYTHKEKCFDKIPFYHQDTIYYVDPISRQTYSIATEITCDGYPANIIALDPDGNDYYLLTPTPEKQDPPAHFEPAEIRSIIQPNTFFAHRAGLYSPKHTKDFLNGILLTKHSDKTIQVLGKAISYDFFHDNNPTFKDNKKSLQSYCTIQRRKGTTDRILTLNTYFTRNWFKTMLINTFGWTYYILTKFGLYYATYQILHFAVKLFYM